MKKLVLFLFIFTLGVGMVEGQNKETPKVRIKTSLGEIVVELNSAKAPTTVENFLFYVERGFFDGTVFHRVIPNFMVQGGGFTTDMQQKSTAQPIINEANNGLSNLRGTIAMARTQVINSATSQFFINLKDNFFLNYQNETSQGYGYCVFGKVIEGMSVVDAIAKVQTGAVGMHQDVPLKPVVIFWAKKEK